MSDWHPCEDHPGGPYHQDLHVDGFKDAFLHIEDTEGEIPILGDYNIVFAGHAVVGGIGLDVNVALGPFPDMTVAEVYVPVVIRHGALVVQAEIQRQLSAGRLGYDDEDRVDAVSDESRVVAAIGAEVLIDFVRTFIDTLDQIPIDVIQKVHAAFKRLSNQYPDTLQTLLSASVGDDPEANFAELARLLPTDLAAALVVKVATIQQALTGKN